MDILLYLTELLQTRKTVGILGLGTLYKKKSPGKYDADKHSFVPPSYTLSFTTAIKEQEELANFISQKRNITIDSANYYIGEFAERIQSELAQQQEANLQPLGMLHLVNDEIHFTPTEEGKIGFEFYGLPELTEPIITNEAVVSKSNEVKENILEEIEEENKLEEENPGQETEDQPQEYIPLNDDQEVFEEITEAPIQQTTYHHLNDLPPIIETVEKEEPVFEEEKLQPVETVIIQQEAYIEEEPKKGMPFFMKFLIVFLIIVALGAIVYFVNPQFFNNYFNKNSAGKPDVVASTTPSDSLTTPIDTNTKDSISQNNNLVTLATDTLATDENSPVVAVTTFEVLVSAVATDKKANKIITNLASQGVKAKKVRLSKTMINISAGSFLTEGSARKYRDSLRIVLKNQGIYIQPIKPKK